MTKESMNLREEVDGGRRMLQMAEVNKKKRGLRFDVRNVSK